MPKFYAMVTAEDLKSQHELEHEVPAIKNYFGLFQTYTPGCWSSPAYLTLTFHGISTFLHSRALSEDIRVIDSHEKLQSFIASIKLNQLYIVIIKRGVLQDNRTDFEELISLGMDIEDIRSALEDNHAQTLAIKKTKLGDNDTVFIANYDCEALHLPSHYCEKLFKANVIISNPSTIRQTPYQGGYHCAIYAISDAITLHEQAHRGNYFFPNNSEQVGDFELDKSLVDIDLKGKAQQYCQELVAFAKTNQHQEPASTNCSI